MSNFFSVTLDGLKFCETVCFALDWSINKIKTCLTLNTSLKYFIETSPSNIQTQHPNITKPKSVSLPTSPQSCPKNFFQILFHRIGSPNIQTEFILVYQTERQNCCPTFSLSLVSINDCPMMS